MIVPVSDEARAVFVEAAVSRLAPRSGEAISRVVLQIAAALLSDATFVRWLN